MKHFRITLLVFSIIFMTACKNDNKDSKVEETEDVEIKKTVEENVEIKKITMSLDPKSDSEVSGSVTFTEENGEVKMVAEMTGLSEGEHAIHIHQKADCSSPDGKSTGGHWNPTAQPHGKWGDATGYHKGDIGNFMVGADGIGNVEFATSEWCIGCGDDTKDILGKAIIVHQGVDDFTSQPSGAAGSRISCGGIIE
ncbi:superoxide dismutase family protein [Winogradskyella tangerina]|uniref:superoxide dismutase family protein n=1 Tax=Winogradskyella tangerina TaxID=2023240 RepID=UPI000DBE8556|nr:superoxide dismutase family protein [Winogradskyella tangerina]